MKKYNLDVQKKLIFPDHYKFSHLEIKDIIDKAKKENLHIIMTEKDFYKVNKFEIPNINYLKVSLEILKKDEFLKIVNKVYV